MTQLLYAELPWPPSINHMYLRKWGTTRRIRNPEAQGYEKDIAKILMVARVKPIRTDARLSVAITVWPPDRRRRDLDNLGKALLDSVTRALGCDDSQIDRLYFERKGVDAPGRVLVQINEIKITEV